MSTQSRDTNGTIIKIRVNEVSSQVGRSLENNYFEGHSNMNDSLLHEFILDLFVAVGDFNKYRTDLSRKGYIFSRFFYS